MNTTLSIPLLIIAVICALVLFSIIRRKQKQEHLVQRVRASDLYGHLYPLLLRCNRRCVESIALKTDSVCIRLYKPAGRTLLYTFEKHGFDPLKEEYLYALAQAVAVEVILLPVKIWKANRRKEPSGVSRCSRRMASTSASVISFLRSASSLKRVKAFCRASPSRV